MAYAYAQQLWSGGRLVGLLGAIAVNVLFIGAIAAGLDFDIIREEQQIIEVIPVVERPTPPIPRQFVDEPDVVDPKPDVAYVPPLFDDVPLPPLEEPVITTTFDPLPPQPIPPEATQLQADPRHPLASPIYPPWSIRREEQGVVTLLIFVKPDGRVGDVRIKRSSGFPKLDEAAVIAARKNWRFQPATQGGAAVAAWGVYAVAFQLKDVE